MSVELVRPSALPKLQECRCFESTAGTSEAALRGTRLDAIIREQWRHSSPVELNAEDEAAVTFAFYTLHALSAGLHVETREEELQAVVPVDGVKAGTMDALCVAGGWLADFKTGQVRSYYAQMAAYALACMDAYFADEWTAHLIFVDQQQVVSHKFTYAEAETCVLDIVHALKVETPCEYCGWCGRFESCPAVSKAAAELTTPTLPALTADAKGKGQLPAVMEGMLTDHAAAHDFLTKLKVVNDWADMLKRKLLDQLSEDGVTNDYFSRVVVSGSKKVNPSELIPHLDKLGVENVLGACAQLPLSKVQTLFGDEAVPDELITISGGTVSLRTKKIKKTINQ